MAACQAVGCKLGLRRRCDKRDKRDKTMQSARKRPLHGVGKAVGEADQELGHVCWAIYLHM